MQRSFTPVGYLLIIFFLLPFSAVQAQDGILDASFGSNGKVLNPSSLYTIPSFAPATMPKILVQPDGKILHIAPTSSVGVFITRYLPGGAVDASFGTNGSVFTSDVQGVYQPRDAWMLTDGRFLIVGESRVNVYGAEQGFAVLRYNADGTLDNRFDGDGKAVAPLASTTPVAYSVAVQPDGKIVVGGTTPGQFAVVRFGVDGGLDTSFSGDGISIIPFENGTSGGEIAIQIDGKIVIAGTTTTPYMYGPQTLYSKDIAVARVLADGTPDPLFDGDGKMKVVNTGSSLYPLHEVTQAIALQPDGKILVGAYTWQESIEGTYVKVMRFNSDGTIDGSFSAPLLNVGGENYPVDMAIQEDGKVLVSGYTKCAYCSTNDYVVFVARFLSGGAVDNSFDGDGKVVLRALSNSKNVGGSLASQGTKLLLGGLTNAGGTGVSALIYRLNNSSPLLPRSPVLWYQDSDGDGYGSAIQAQVAYLQPAGYIARSGDCNDSDASVHPGATEVQDGKDNDCNGVVDDVISYTTIPAKIEAEAYSNQSGTQLEATSDAGGGQNVGYIDNGDWMEYAITVPVSGEYTLRLRLATPSVTNPQLTVQLDGQVITTIDIPNTGGFQTWTTVETTVTLTKGDHILRLVSTGGGYWNINWLEISNPFVHPGYTLIPAKIEAEAFAAMSGVQTEETSDEGGGQNVGYIDWGDWMDYNITVPTAGMYEIRFRVASPSINHPQFEIWSGDQKLAVVNVPNTGGFQQWQTISVTASLPQGNQTIRVLSTGGGYWNINWLEFATLASTVSDISFESLATLSSDQCPYGDVPVRAVIRNVGTSMINFAATNLSVRVEITGAGRQTLTANITSGLLAPNATEVIDVWPRANLNAGGNYILNGVATLAGDNNVVNNETVFTKTIVPTTSAPWSESFDALSTPAGWDIGGWHVSSVHGRTTNGLSANVLSYAQSLFRTLAVGFLRPDDVLSFDYRILNRDNYPNGGTPEGNWGNFKIQLSTDCGATFSDFATVDATNHIMNGQEWTTRSYSLAAFAGYRIVIRMVATWASGDYFIDFDNFAIQENGNYTTRFGGNAPPVQGFANKNTNMVPILNSLQVYPSPVINTLTLLLKSEYTGQMNIEVLDINGRVQKRFSVNKQSVSTTTTLPLSSLPTGVYLLQVQMNGWIETRKFIKE